MAGNYYWERALEQIHEKLSKWREQHCAPTPIPSEIWERAAELSVKLGSGRVAKALRLNSAVLKRRVGRGPMVARTTTFVEVATQIPSTSCVLEVQSLRGSRLRLEWSNPAPADIAAVLREFVDEG